MYRQQGYEQEEGDDQQQGPDGQGAEYWEFYRKNFSNFASIAKHLENRLYIRSFKERRWMQPHYSSLVNIMTPYSNILNPADGVCTHFLSRGMTKIYQNRVLVNCGMWSADARWLVLATQTGDFILWENETLKARVPISVLAHKDMADGNRVLKEHGITAMAWKNFSNLIVTGGENGTIQYCDEVFRNVSVTRGAHARAVRGLSFSPFDSKLVSCSDDASIKLWTGGRDEPELEMQGHLQDIKCVDWHPFRSLIASGSRDTKVMLWDPKTGNNVSTIACSERQVNCLQWNANGNWLATGATDGFVKVYDIRVMKELETWRVNNGEDSVCKIAWHPIHESLLVSGTFNGSLAYWITGQSNNQIPHSLIRNAHRLSIDVLAWHPSGNLLASTSHDLMLKFWCREPPGSKLEPPPARETQNQENPISYFHGPLPDKTYIPPVRNPSTTPSITSASAGQSGRFGQAGRGMGGRGNYRSRDQQQQQGDSRKRPREIANDRNYYGTAR